MLDPSDKSLRYYAQVMALSVAKWYDYRPDNQDVVGSNVASSWAIFLPLSFILMYYSVLDQGPQGVIRCEC